MQNMIWPCTDSLQWGHLQPVLFTLKPIHHFTVWPLNAGLMFPPPAAACSMPLWLKGRVQWVRAKASSVRDGNWCLNSLYHQWGMTEVGCWRICRRLLHYHESQGTIQIWSWNFHHSGKFPTLLSTSAFHSSIHHAILDNILIMSSVEGKFVEHCREFSFGKSYTWLEKESNQCPPLEILHWCTSEWRTYGHFWRN